MATSREYRLTRNIEASLIDQLKDRLAEADWQNIRVEKAFARVYDGSAPCLLVEVTQRPIKTVEIGSNHIYRDAEVTVRFFAENDGQRADFTDWLTCEFQELWDYYVFSIQEGAVINKAQAGKMRLTMTQNRKEYLNTWNTDTVEKLDRYRQLIIMTCRISINQE